MTGFEHAWQHALRAFALIGGVLLFLLAVMVTTDVLARYFTGRPLIGVFEFAEIGLVYIAFLSIGYVQFGNQHLRVDILSSRARGRTAGGLRVLDSLTALFFYGVILVSACREWIKAWQGGFLRRGFIQIPTTVLMSAIVIGCALICLTILWQLARGARQVYSGIDEHPPAPDTLVPP